MREFSSAPIWDERYQSPDYLFGVEPSAFLRRNVDHLVRGSSALVLGDGEGRNSVFIAEHGLSVTAMDISEVAVEKARALARRRGVSVDLRVADILEWSWDEDAFDLVIGVFIQFLSPDQRALVFAGMARTLRPGGRLLLHGYRLEQLRHGTGGPPVPEFLYTQELLASSFPGLEIEQLTSHDAVLEEGSGHVGQSALIDLVARKP